MPIRKCSCEESEYLRKALRAIRTVCNTDTGQPMIEDLAQCNNLAGQGLGLRGLSGDFGVYDVRALLDAAAGRTVGKIQAGILTQLKCAKLQVPEGWAESTARNIAQALKGE